MQTPKNGLWRDFHTVLEKSVSPLSLTTHPVYFVICVLHQILPDTPHTLPPTSAGPQKQTSGTRSRVMGIQFDTQFIRSTKTPWSLELASTGWSWEASTQPMGYVTVSGAILSYTGLEASCRSHHCRTVCCWRGDPHAHPVKPQKVM